MVKAKVLALGGTRYVRSLKLKEFGGLVLSVWTTVLLGLDGPEAAKESGFRGRYSQDPGVLVQINPLIQS